MKNLLFICFVLTFLSSCKSIQPEVRINGQIFVVEIADDNHSREMGLMFREEMNDDAGMLFIFPNEIPRAFWMKNTLIPLDILYFGSNKKLVKAQTNIKPCKNTSSRCPNYPSIKPAQYVLEINAGLTEKLGIKLGDELEIMLKK